MGGKGREMSECSYDYQASMPSGDISRSLPGHRPRFCACQHIDSLPTVMAPGPLTESRVDTEQMTRCPWTLSGHHRPRAGQEALGHTADETESGLRKLGGKGKRKYLAEAKALLPDGSTGFESGTKLQRYQRPILEKVPTPGNHHPQPWSWSTKDTGDAVA